VAVIRIIASNQVKPVRCAIAALSILMALCVSAKADEAADRLTWRNVKLGMSEAQVRTALAKEGFPIKDDLNPLGKIPSGPDDLYLQAGTLGVDVYSPCMPDETKDCYNIFARFVRGKSTKRLELTGLEVSVWLHHPALVSKLLEPITAKYGTPVGQGQDGRYSQSKWWTYVWRPVASIQSAKVQLSIQNLFSPSSVPNPDDTSSSVKYSIMDDRLARAREKERTEMQKSAPPPIRY
jgi:hypothetical protein